MGSRFLVGGRFFGRARLRPTPGIARGLAYQVIPSQICALEPKITVRAEHHPTEKKPSSSTIGEREGARRVEGDRRERF
jgi:hypothetical protein